MKEMLGYQVDELEAALKMPLSFKVPLTPKYFLNRNKTLFGVDYFGVKISAIGLFLDFL